MPAHSSGAACVERDAVGDAQHEVLVDDDVRAVATVGPGVVLVVVLRVVGADVALEAVLLLAGLAVLAFAARVDHAADADVVADLVLADLGADLFDDTGDLVTRDEREVCLAPLVAPGVDVGVADAGERDLDQDVFGPDLAALDLRSSRTEPWRTGWRKRLQLP